MARRELIFRVFVSSTFSDLIAERNALQETVYPKLRAYCQERKARFQAIDLRWGVSEEAALDQQTMKICLEELKRCQALLPRPKFIVRSSPLWLKPCGKTYPRTRDHVTVPHSGADCV